VNVDKIVNVLGMIVGVAMVTTVVQNGSQAAQVVRGLGGFFQGSIRAAMGH
jgi:hypothetical protein